MNITLKDYINMGTKGREKVRVHSRINASMERVWKCWITTDDIIKWNNASEDWHTTHAENDLRQGGKFNYRMESIDGSMGFDFWGVYERVITFRQIEYVMGDGRKAKVLFSSEDNQTVIEETFEAESTNSIELQRYGWQSILNNFKKYAESCY
jgi:uncharacterized protein YndB with AHSA1/START domain